MKARLGVGIIGLGRMGHIYASHLAALAGVQIVSVSDVVPDRAEAIAGNFGAGSWTVDYQDILVGPDTYEAILAMALAETHNTEAVQTLIHAIADRQGLAAYEACRALHKVFGLNLGLDAQAWERWLAATEATRD